jgi:hypothetical protein
MSALIKTKSPQRLAKPHQRPLLRANFQAEAFGGADACTLHSDDLLR